MLHDINPVPQEQLLEETKGYYRTGIGLNNKKTASVSCPRCGMVFSLSNHNILNNGRVTPSVICDERYGGCGWHDYMILINWTP